MEIFSVSVSWENTSGVTQIVRFTCARSQVINQVNLSLTNDVAPTFAQNCSISIQSLGNVRGALV